MDDLTSIRHASFPDGIEMNRKFSDFEFRIISEKVMPPLKMIESLTSNYPIKFSLMDYAIVHKWFREIGS